MILNLKIPNLPLLPATLAQGAKYGASKFTTDGTSPYPIAIDGSVCIPLTLKSGGKEMRFAEAVVSIGKERNMVTTPVVDGRGTVKETISWGDVSVNITLAVVSTTEDGDYDGQLTTQYDVYPIVGVKRLRELLDEDERIYITSEFLSAFDLDNDTDYGIVVKSYSMEQQTHANRQVVTINAVSDYDYELLIQEEGTI